MGRVISPLWSDGPVNGVFKTRVREYSLHRTKGNEMVCIKLELTLAWKKIRGVSLPVKVVFKYLVLKMGQGSGFNVTEVSKSVGMSWRDTRRLIRKVYLNAQTMCEFIELPKGETVDGFADKISGYIRQNVRSLNCPDITSNMTIATTSDDKASLNPFRIGETRRLTVSLDRQPPTTSN